ncbi:MAG: hypothetical protein LBC85_12465 [Fibromonadaceae bacterium]|jgi:hypothetical protein|nr:hypothetical protein [Fibromonadaceae bacterium]
MNEELKDINKTLEKQNEIIQKILNVMPKESGKFARGLEIIVLFVGVFGIIALIDIVRNWIGG